MPWDPGQPSRATPRTPLLGEWNRRRWGQRLHRKGVPPPRHPPFALPPLLDPGADRAAVLADAQAAARNRQRRSARG